jgi:aminoglycoside 6-adenylyltransferase
LNKYYINNCEIDSIDLKCLVVSKGVKVSKEVYKKFSKTHRLGINPLMCNSMFLSDGTIVQLTDMSFHLQYLTGILSWDNLKLLKYVQDLETPFSLKVYEGKPTLFYNSEFVDEVTKPEDMELFPPSELGFSYLMLFDDYNKVDLTLIPLNCLEEYLKRDKLVTVLLDKDNRIKEKIIPTDEEYHIRKPTMRQFDDCCNEFWHVSTYVVKGLMRREILYSIAHLGIVRRELLRMMSWKVGLETHFSLSVGKNYKYLKRYVSDGLWNRLMTTYRMDTYENCWNSLFTCLDLFREVSKEVAVKLCFEYPDNDFNLTKYVMDMYKGYE